MFDLFDLICLILICLILILILILICAEHPYPKFGQLPQPSPRMCYEQLWIPQSGQVRASSKINLAGSLKTNKNWFDVSDHQLDLEEIEALLENSDEDVDEIEDVKIPTDLKLQQVTEIPDLEQSNTEHTANDMESSGKHHIINVS